VRSVNLPTTSVRTTDNAVVRAEREPLDGVALVARAIRDHAPTFVFALFSGGHDSLCATHVAAQHPAFSGVVHINTGVGIKATHEFVRATCSGEGWPLLEYRPPRSYESLVMEHGFPGPAAHTFMYRNLKERCVRALMRDHKTARHDRIVLVSGARSGESVRRMGTVQAIHRDCSRVWVAPIHSWTTTEVNAYIETNGLPRNSVVDLLHMSGECLCGAYARNGERAELELWFPEEAGRIRRLEARARKAGVPAAWGTPPSGRRTHAHNRSPLCHDCTHQAFPTPATVTGMPVTDRWRPCARIDCLNRIDGRSRRRDAIYCSNACRQKTYRNRRPPPPAGLRPQTKACDRCLNAFIPDRADARYCSNRCRQAAYRQRARVSAGR
jgi:3'-phosphoadenosine 5'-phosphosulfate sulfotransferase (PAPS reductase)/FAD synthetase